MPNKRLINGKLVAADKPRLYTRYYGDLLAEMRQLGWDLLSDEDLRAYLRDHGREHDREVVEFTLAIRRDWDFQWSAVLGQHQGLAENMENHRAKHPSECYKSPAAIREWHDLWHAAANLTQARLERWDGFYIPS